GVLFGYRKTHVFSPVLQDMLQSEFMIGISEEKVNHTKWNEYACACPRSTEWYPSSPYRPRQCTRPPSKSTAQRLVEGAGRTNRARPRSTSRIQVHRRPRSVLRAGRQVSLVPSP